MSGAIATAGILAGVGAAGSIGGALIGSNAAGNAADTQSQAAQNAAQLQYQASQNALDFQKQQWNQQQANLAPWLNSGAAGLSNLDYLLGITPPTTQGAIAGYTPSAAPATYGGMQNPIRPAGGPALPTGGQSASAPAPSGGPVVRAGSALSLPQSYTEGSQPPSAVGGPIQPISYNPNAGPQGQTNLGSMVNPSLGGFGSLMQGYGKTFEAPTGLTMENDPGYQARLKIGTDALQRSAAARGNLLTGGTAKDLTNYAQDYASNEYGNVYNRAFNQYAQGYNQFQQEQANQYNRLASLAGIGQQTAGQLGYLGNSAAQGVTSNLLNTAQNMGQQYNNAAAATASGYVGGANAWQGALGNIGNNLSNLYMMNQSNPYQTLYNAQHPDTSLVSTTPYDLSGITIG